MRARHCFAVGIGAFLVPALTSVAMADDAQGGLPQGSTPASSSTPSPMIHVQVGGAGQVQMQPPHRVSVSSDTEGTRVLQLDTSEVLVAGQMAYVSGPRQQVCTAPCTASLTPTATYVIRGYNIVDSAHFGISEETKELHVHAGNDFVSSLGVTSVTLGLLSALAGGVFLVVGVAKGPADSSSSTFTNVGWGGLIGGAALIGVGVILELTNVTHIYDEKGARLAKARPRFTASGLVF
jgi:hypothetical protein